MSNTLKGILLASFAGFCWGSMGVAAQYLFTHCSFSPQDLVSIRLMGAGALLLVFECLVSRKPLLSPLLHDFRNLRDILIYGATLVTCQLTYFLSIEAANAGLASLMVGFVPLFVIFWIAARARRPVRAKEIGCLFLAMGGVALLVTKGDFTSLNFSILGVFWGIVSAALVAVGTLQPAAAIKRTDVCFTTGWAMFLGGALDLFFSSPFSSGAAWTPDAVAAYAYVVLFGTVFAFGCYLRSTAFVPASVSSLLTSIEPLTAVILTVLLLGVPFSLPEAAGAAMVIANMILLSLKGKR